MQHNKTILFLISLSQRTIQDIEDKGVNYQLFLQMVRSYSHVEIHEEISEELIGTASRYRLVIIVGHNINDCIELADGSLFPMRKIASAIPPTFDGYLHVAVCNSSIIFDAIKERCPNSRVRTSEDFEELELEFHIYSELLSRSDLRKETFDDYYDSFYNYIKEEQEHKKPEDLAKLPWATKLGTMSTSAVPPRAFRNSPFPVKVYIHADGEEVDICAEIEGYRRHIKRNLKLNDGDQISWNLSFNTDPEPYENLNKHILGAGSHSETWNGNYSINFTFDCFVRPEFKLNGFTVVLNTTIDNEELDTCKFSVEVRPYKNCESNFEMNDEKEKRTNNNIVMGQSWMTRKAERVFVGAFNEKWIKHTENGFKWIGFGKPKKNGLVISRTRKLAYLCHEIFGDDVPWEDIETFFGEKKLSRDWGNIHGNIREHQQWMYKIDHLIEDNEVL